jgi:hypothetical protein
MWSRVEAGGYRRVATIHLDTLISPGLRIYPKFLAPSVLGFNYHRSDTAELRSACELEE